ncbi:MAG: hypothetical protein ACYSTO_09735 [Planctomycetota bacterium]
MCMADENEMNLILAQALLKLQQDVKDIKESTNSLSTVISNHVKFFEGVGDIGEQMSNTLQNIMEERDISFKNTLLEFEKTQQFLKDTESKKYRSKNLLDESFLDLLTSVMVENTPDNITIKDIESYINVSIQAWERDNNINPKDIQEYEDRIRFHEDLMQKAKHEISFSDFGFFVARSIFIPYISMYHSKPLYNYPHLNEYMKQMRKYKTLVDKKD